ncbi:hypothetical protein GHK52_02250 [Lactococcus garvieae]|nr:hypothetical protein [Lactococcus garvieae]
MKYTKNDGQLLSSALKHNLKIANQIVEDVQGGVNHLLNLLESGALSGQAYHAAATLFKEIVTPAVQKLKESTRTIKAELQTFDQARRQFDTYPDPVYDEEVYERLLELKRQQKARVDLQLDMFNSLLVTGLAKEAIKDFVYEGQRLQSVSAHYEQEIQELENKLRILHDFSSATAGLFQESLQAFQSAMHGARALSWGSFDSRGRFRMPSDVDLSWYKKMTGKSISKNLLHAPKHIKLGEIEMAKVSQMNAKTQARLKRLAKEAGLTLAEAMALYIEASRTVLTKTGEGAGNVWDFISKEFGKLNPQNRVKGGDIIKTVVYYTNSGEVKIIYNETQNVVLSFGGGVMANMNKFNGINADSGVEYVAPQEQSKGWKKGQEQQAEKGQMTLDILGDLTSAKDFVNSYKFEEKESISGKEYLDNLAKEKERKLQEEAIKAQQRISGGGNPASLGS